jgi:hypothetical protein
MPTLRGYMGAVRQLLWTLHNQARETGSEVTGWTSFLCWLLSADPIAHAARQGICDYIRRRFGCRPAVGSPA